MDGSWLAAVVAELAAVKMVEGGLVVWLLGSYGICWCCCLDCSRLAAVTVALIAIKIVEGVITSVAARVVADIVAWPAAGWQLCGRWVAAVWSLGGSCGG